MLFFLVLWYKDIIERFYRESTKNYILGRGSFRMNNNQNQDYTVFGGWLMVWYWCLIVGGILILLTMVIPALVSIAASFLVGFVYAAGILVSIASVCVSAVFEIKAAIQLKARAPQFFDILLFATVISVGGGILANLLKIRNAYGVTRFIGSTISSLIGFAIGMCLCIMYFSKSVRVNAYFGGRPLQQSRYWNWIKLLPQFIISDTMPDPSKMRQMGSRPQQSDGQAQDPQSSSTAQSQNTDEQEK